MNILQISKEDLKTISSRIISPHPTSFFSISPLLSLGRWCVPSRYPLVSGCLSSCCEGSPLLNIGCKIKGPHLLQEAYVGVLATVYPFLSSTQKREKAAPLPVPGLHHQFSLEFLAAGESYTKELCFQWVQIHTQGKARIQPHKFLPKFSVFSRPQHSNPPFWHFPGEKFDTHSPQ